MTRNRVVRAIRAVLLPLIVGVFSTLAAMPTRQELSQAEPLVQEVMKAEIEALRRGKKTREQVGDAAVALAAAAQASAEKFILLTGAFDYYMRGGAYDKAASALEAVRKAVPDWKGSDEFALIEKAMRSVAFGKGGPVRERYEELKARQQYAIRLKKALAQAQAKPSDKKLQFQVATYSAALDRWPQALDAFIAGSSPTCAAAAKLEKESAPPAKIADAWWSALDVKPDFLSSAIRVHAVELYAKALADPSFAGLPRVAAEKRIKETSAAESASDSPTKSFDSSSNRSVCTARYYGVELVGGSVKENKGILSDFANHSYAKIKAPFDPKDKSFEVVVEFTTGQHIDTVGGILIGLGPRNGYSPLFISRQKLSGFLSSDGTTWNIAGNVPVGDVLKPMTTYLVKSTWDRKAYSWYLYKGNAWAKEAVVLNEFPVAATELQFGTNRGEGYPFSGTVNLNKSYICIDGKVWWEGVKGAYKNANR